MIVDAPSRENDGCTLHAHTCLVIVPIRVRFLFFLYAEGLYHSVFTFVHHLFCVYYTFMLIVHLYFFVTCVSIDIEIVFVILF